MFPTLIGTVVIAGIVGYVSEKSGFTRNGILQSIIICIGGAFLFYFVRLMFGFGFSSPERDRVINRRADHRADALAQKINGPEFPLNRLSCV